MKRRILIDYTAGAWQGAGIGRYTRELVKAVVTQAPAQYEFALFYAAGWPWQRVPYQADIDAVRTMRAGTTVHPIPLPSRRLTQLWHRLGVRIPIEWWAGDADLVHAPDFVLPPTRIPGIVTIHDLSYLVHPECAVPGVARYLREAVPPSLARAVAVAADSASTKADVVRLLGVSAAAIDVVYAGVDARFQPLPAADLVAVRARYDLPERFVLSGGTLV